MSRERTIRGKVLRGDLGKLSGGCAEYSGVILSADQIANVAAAAGFSGNDLVTAVAIALAESDGDPGAHNICEDSRGLWQIHVPAHPDAAGANLYDPQVNAQYAFKYYAQSGFYPWTTWTSGKFARYLDAAQNGVMADARGESYDPVVTGLPSADGNYLPIATPQTNPAVIALAIGGTIIGVKLLFDKLEELL
jgi:hypothetical protein